MKNFYKLCFYESIILCLFLILRLVAPMFPLLVETVYAQRLFVWRNAASVWFSSLLDFSLAPMYIGALLCLALVCVVTMVLLLLNKRFAYALALTVALLLFAGSQYVALYANWGLNYYRMPISYALDLPIGARDPQLLYDLCINLSARAAKARAFVPEDENGVVCVPNQKAALHVGAAYESLNAKFDAFDTRVQKTKPLIFSEVFNYLGITGIYFPFTRDANVNVRAHPLLLSATAMHEAAHLVGVGAEDEANFVGFLASLCSPDTSVQYSGLMLALINAGNALNGISPDAYRALRATYSDEMNRDLDDYGRFWQQYKGEVQELAEKVNDNYLKSNGQLHGVRSYGMMVNLLLDAYAAGWFEAYF